MKNEQPLVSIMTPCFNGEKFVARFLESVLDQTYMNIELIFVNDGSTDKTEDIVLGFKDRFTERGIELTYIYQQNAGQAAAINQALTLLRGKYVTWPDSDDILHRDNILKKVEFLESNKEFDFVLCKTIVIEEGSLKEIGVLERKKVVETKRTLFVDLIKEKNIYYAPGGYMAVTKSLLAVLNHKQIQVSKGGQNWQLLLPLAYHYRCGYINDYLYYYVVRENSHSRSNVLLEQQLVRCDEHEHLLLLVMKGITDMSSSERKIYDEMILQKYRHKRLKLAAEFQDTKLVKDFYSLLKSEGVLSVSDRYFYFYGTNRIFFNLINCLKRIKRYLLQMWRKK